MPKPFAVLAAEMFFKVNLWFCFQAFVISFISCPILRTSSHKEERLTVN